MIRIVPACSLTSFPFVSWSGFHFRGGLCHLFPRIETNFPLGLGPLIASAIIFFYLVFNNYRGIMERSCIPLVSKYFSSEPSLFHVLTECVEC